jgi:ATP-dependent Clp protease protease subunit
MSEQQDNQEAQMPFPFEFRQPNLSDRGIYYFCGEFNQQTTRDAISWILDANFQEKSSFDNLTMIISSFGGDLFSAFALIDVMRGSRIPIHTVGLGIIASAGLMTFIAGKKGHRMITPNTSILSHQWSAGSSGKEHELVATQKQYELTTKRMINHYKKCTGLSEKIIREKLLPPQDIWLSSDEALEYKLVDIVKEMK